MEKDKQPKKYLEREISWMYFNHRLLQESQDETVPLLERLTFLGIYSNNLDEFFKVRVALLNRISQLKNPSLKAEAVKAKNILSKINQLNKKYSAEFEETFTQLKQNLADENIFITDEKELTDIQIKEIQDLFTNDLSKYIFPRMITSSSDFDNIEDENVYLAIKLTKQAGQIEYATIKLPCPEKERFVKIKSDDDDKHLIIFLDDIIRLCLPSVFVGSNYEKYEAFTFKLTKDASIDIEPNLQGDIMDKIARAVKNRRKGNPVRFIYDESMPKDLLLQIEKIIGIKKWDSIIAGGKYHNFKDLMAFPSCMRKDLRYPQWKTLPHKLLMESSSPLDLILQKDILIHYPYHSFSNYIRLLRQAAISKDVQVIKITLYRLAKNSSVVEALICAAENGKKVTAVVELLARFDEASNIYWSKKMQDAGINVIHGIEGLKVHAKMTYIKSTKGNIACISTGNFHEGNANIYTDVLLMTGNKKIVKEVNDVFHFIEKPYETLPFKELLVAPINLRNKIKQLINNEIKNAKAGKPAYIMCKLNHITDLDIIDKLYEAANAGVEIKLLVRGSCSIKTRMKELHSNISIKGIIDKYLEHSRIFIFGGGGEEKYYLGSADWITRNFNSRVEVLAPVYDKDVQAELKLIVEYGLHDNVKGRIVDGTGSNIIDKKGKEFRSQEELYKYYQTRYDE